MEDIVLDREYKSSLRCLKIGDKVAELPIIQGGMGVGVSRSSLAGAVAAEGGVGVISTAQESTYGRQGRLPREKGWSVLILW